MRDFKNLKLPERTHELLVLRANALGMKVYTLADTLLLAGLKLNNEATLRLVAEEQQGLTQPAGSTSPGAAPPQP
jgi:hypothetical protein